MSEYPDSNSAAPSNAAMALETLTNGKPAPDEAPQAVETAVESMRDLQIKLIDMAEAHAQAVFDFARQIARASEPSDIIASCNAHGRTQFEMLAAQTHVLTALGQKIAGSAAAPVMRSAQQAFGKVS